MEFACDFHIGIKTVSVYTLSDLGDLRNLIGSLSQAIQQYSPPSEWIMSELSFSPFFRERPFECQQNSRVDFFRQEKTSKDSKQRFSIYCS